MSSVLVTGAAGFVGRHVVRGLRDAGHDVRELDWPENLAEVGRVEGFDAVVNLAAIGGVGRAARSPAEVMKNNVGATIALRGALSPEVTISEGEHGSTTITTWPLVVHVSSFSVYGDAPTPTREDAPIAPREVYGASKAAQELCWAGYEGPLWVLRCSSIYGSGMRLDDSESTVVAKVARAARDGATFRVYGDGEQVRDFVHVGDVVAAIVGLVEATEMTTPVSTSFSPHVLAPGARVVNACSGEGTSIRGLCELFCAAYEMAGPERPGDVRVCRGDPRRFRELLGRDPASIVDRWREVLTLARVARR